MQLQSTLQDIKQPPRQRPSRVSILLAVSLLTLEILAVAKFSCLLQSQYYKYNGPFFDSDSYYNKLAQVYYESRTTGVLTAFEPHRASTVFLPWAEVALLAPFHPLTRSLAVWLQSLWLFPLAASLLYYQITDRKLTLPLALAATIPFFGFHAIFNYNGGLCDFRMDLSLWIFYSLASIWLLIALNSKTTLPWLLWGISCGLGCLARSTAPAYFAVAFIPLLIAHRFANKNRRPMFRGLATGTITGAFICGWFYLANFKDLLSYYFVWNHDAVHHLPLTQALLHIRFAYTHLGLSTIIFCLIFALTTTAIPRSITQLNWKPLYLGCAPIAMLIAQRAGLNPFISMPAVFGLMLFLIQPISTINPRRPTTPVSVLLILLACAAVTSSAIAGLASQTSPDASANSMPAQLEIAQRILTDARAHHLKSAQFATGSYVRTTNTSLTNVMIFDLGMHTQNSTLVSPDLTVSTDDLFQAGELINWQQIPGKTDRDRIDFLADRACNNLNYIIFPDDQSLAFLKHAYSDQPIDRYCTELRDATLQRGHWRTVGPPIAGSKHETQIIYSNEGLPAKK